MPTVFAPWKAQVLKQRQMDIELYMQLLNEIREKVARGIAPPCFAKHGLEEQANLGMTDLELAYAISTPFGAGVETVQTPERLPLSKSMRSRTNTYISSPPGPLRALFLRVSSMAPSSSLRRRQSSTKSLGQTGCPTLTISLTWSMSALLRPRPSAGGRWLFWEGLRTRARQMTRTRACSSPREVPSSPHCGAVSGRPVPRPSGAPC